MPLALSPACPDESTFSLRHYLQGVLYEQQGDYARALKEYESVVILDPTAAYVFRRQAELALELGDLEKALLAAQRSLELEGPNAEGYRLLGNVRWARGETGPARQAFAKAVELEPRFTEAWTALANLTAASDPEAAKRHFERVLELAPEDAAEPLFQIAMLEQRQGRLGAAHDRLRAAIAAEPDALQARYALAQLFEVRQDTAAALAEYEEILRRESRNPSLWVRVGEIRGMAGDGPGALEAFSAAKALQPDHPGACFWLAVKAEERGDFAAAAEALRASAHLASDPKLNLRLGYYLTQAGRLPEAVRLLTEAFRKWPKSAEVGYFLALGLNDTGEPAKAAAVLEAVVRLDPASRDARFELAALYEKLGRIDDAAREFRVLIASRPDDAQALNYLGYALADRGRDLPEALAWIQRAVALEPANGAYLDSLGWAHFRLGRSTEALVGLKAAVAALPTDETIWEHLGDVYLALRDPGAAWAAWKRSLLLKPSHRKVADKLAALEGGMASAELGERTLAFLRETQGALSALLGSCTVTGRVAGREVNLSGLVHFQRSSATAAAPASGSVRVEMLGPFFLPLWRAYLGPDGAFAMDPLAVEGVAAGALEAAVGGALRTLRDHWSGALFAGPGGLRKGWSKKWLETPEHLLFLSANHLYLQAAESRSGGPAVRYRNFQNLRGHPLPKVVEIEGPGYALRLQLEQIGAEFVESQPNLP